MRLTKIDVAEAHLITGIQATFRGDHPASVYLLAASAREILTRIGSEKNIRTVLHGIAESSGKKLGRVVEEAHQYAAFLKHADKDPNSVLDDFTQADADAVLFVAGNDFGRITGGMPIELQVYEAWWLSINYRRISEAPIQHRQMLRRAVQKLFPRIRSASRQRQLELGTAALAGVKHDPRMVMRYERDVRQIPTRPPRSAGSIRSPKTSRL